jgi:multiple antibiotic resistance protein
MVPRWEPRFITQRGRTEGREHVGTDTLTFELVVEIFLLLLIGIGPKIALVPYVETTKDMDKATKSKVMHKMLVTAGSVGLILVVLGEFLARLLHFSTGSLSIAGGIILLIISVTMVLGSGDDEARQSSVTDDPMKAAVYPLAVPYLLNPAGIVALVTLSGEAETWGFVGVVLALLALMLILDYFVFRWANGVSKHLDESRMLITEKVFGFLLAALGVQLILNGLSDVGVIHLIH